MAEILLRDVILKHDVAIKTGHYGKTVHVLVFFDPKSYITWCWKTTTLPTFQVHNSYSIICRDEGDYNISHVREVDFDHGSISKDVESEQPDTRDAWDELFNDTNLTLNEKYDIM